MDKLACNPGVDERGAIYTRREVVEFMLDLAGYTPDNPLHRLRLLEPCFGSGEFLLEAVRRLLTASARLQTKVDLAHCIRAVELHKSTFQATKTKLAALLFEHGFEESENERLLAAWLISGDFLLQPMQGQFDVVAGNPPYVRQELIPAALLAQYRKLYATLYDRADLYVPFIERSLSMLAEGGQLVFICADRWTKNKYGGPLRALISKGFHLRAYVDMANTPAFDSDVMAYPAVVLVERNTRGATAIGKAPSIDKETLSRLGKSLRAAKPCPDQGISLITDAISGSEPWVFSSSDKRMLLRRLEATFPTLEEAGCKVGIGVATGADKAFIAPMDDLDVEASRKLPLATTKDLASGTILWTGLGVLNPFGDDGALVDLSTYPKLRDHLERHREIIAARHVARKSPANWYRTIDRITPSLAARPKLLIPDIKGAAHVVFEDGKLYPHHNLYFIISEHWDLRALQAILLSNVAHQFVAAYSTAMRGGFLRFQAQYLRRIRLPLWSSVPLPMRAKLVEAAKNLDLPACDKAACELYGLTPDEANLITRC